MLVMYACWTAVVWLLNSEITLKVGICSWWKYTQLKIHRLHWRLGCSELMLLFLSIFPKLHSAQTNGNDLRVLQWYQRGWDNPISLLFGYTRFCKSHILLITVTTTILMVNHQNMTSRLNYHAYYHVYCYIHQTCWFWRSFFCVEFIEVVNTFHINFMVEFFQQWTQ